MDLVYGEGNEDSAGPIMLGYWDHKNTYSVIKELEETVNSAEKKCTALMRELMKYKKYYQSQDVIAKNNFMSANLKKIKTKKSIKNGKISKSISDNSITKKSFFNKDECFYKKFKKKILEVHDEITHVNMKIGFNNNFIFPTEEYKKDLMASVNSNVTPAISLDSEKFKDYCSDSFKLTKSDPTLGDKDKNKLYKNYDYSKITKDELALYQKLSSSIDIKRDKSMKSPKEESRNEMRSKSLQDTKTNSYDKIELTISEPIFLSNKAPSENDTLPTLYSSASRSLIVDANIEECISLMKEKNIKPNIEATLNVEMADKCIKAISDLFVSNSKNFSKLSSSADNCNDSSKAVDSTFNGTKNISEAPKKKRFKHTSGGFNLENLRNEKKKGAGGDDGKSFKEELSSELSAIHDDFLNLHKKYSILRGNISKNMENSSTFRSDVQLKAADYEDLINHYAKVLSSIPKRRSEEGSDRKNFQRSTSTVTLTKVLRKIQNLQDRIKSIP